MRYFDEQDARCHDCGTISTGSLVAVLLCTLLPFAVIGVARALSRHPQSRFHRLCPWIAPALRYLVRNFKSLGWRAKLKVCSMHLQPMGPLLAAHAPSSRSQIVIGFYQICSDIDTNFSVVLPTYFTDVFTFFKAFELDWVPIILPPQACLGGFRGRLLIYALSPLGLLGFLLVLAICYHARYSPAPRDVRPVGRIAQACKKALLRIAPLALLVIFIFVPSVSELVFQVWGCDGFRHSEPLEDRYYMRHQLSIRCYSDEHHKLYGVAYTLIALWPMGGLVLFAALLLAARRNILHRAPNLLYHSTAFLHRDYRPECYLWDVLDLARRTILSAARRLDSNTCWAYLRKPCPERACWLPLTHSSQDRHPRSQPAGCCSSMSATRLCASSLLRL